MDRAVQELFNLGIAESTGRVYKTAQRRYLSFYRDYAQNAIPLSDNVLCLFVAFLALQGLKHQSIKCYVAGLRHLQIQNGGGDPFALARFPRLEYVLKEIKRSGGPVSADRRLPITPDILDRLRVVWSRAQTSQPDVIMLWAACCLGFYGFLRSGEFTVRSDSDFDPSSSLTTSDIAVDDHANPTLISVVIKQSKTDPFRAGVRIFIGRTGCLLCPVAAILGNLAVRPKRAVRCLSSKTVVF